MISLLLIIVIIFVITYCIYWYATIPNNLPPGPLGLPVVGSMLEMKCAENDVVVLEKWTKKYGPLFKFYMGRKLIVVLANYESIEKTLIKQAEAYSGRPIFKALYTERFHSQRTGFLLTDGESWKEQRRFALTNLKELGMGKSRLQHQIIETAEVLLQELELAASSNEPVDLLDTFNKAVGNVICMLAFGRTFEGEEFWRQLKLINFRVSESGISFLSPVAYFPFLAKTPFARRKYDSYFIALNTTLTFVKSLIDQISQYYNEHLTSSFEKQHPENYVHSFLKAQNDQVGKYFTDNEMLASVAQLFAAGSDTTSTTLKYALYYLSLETEIQDQVYDEIVLKFGKDRRILNWEDRTELPYTESCLMEVQRLANLLPLSFMHRTLAKTAIDRYYIPEDTLVIPFLGGVLNDPKYFPEPAKFDPRRFLTEENKIKKIEALIPFSIGKRVCLGESLAKMELFIFFTGLIMRFKFSFPENEPRNKCIERHLGFLSHPKNYKLNLSIRK